MRHGGYSFSLIESANGAGQHEATGRLTAHRWLRGLSNRTDL